MGINTGGPAFPQIDTETVGNGGEYSDRVYSYGGMTLRDYFAAKASEADIMAMQHKVPREVDGVTYTDLPPNWRQTARYLHADAMLAERDGVSLPPAIVNAVLDLQPLGDSQNNGTKLWQMYSSPEEAELQIKRAITRRLQGLK